jgi:hypothetical protein
MYPRSPQPRDIVRAGKRIQCRAIDTGVYILSDGGFRDAFAHLLTPHRVVETFPGEQILVRSLLDDAAELKDIDAAGVHNSRKAMGDEARDGIAAGGDVPDGTADLLFREGVKR